MNRKEEYMRYTTPYMNFIMTPPRQDQAKYEMYEPSVSTMRIVSNDGRGSGLGEVPVVVGGSQQQDWITPVVVIVVSAMALMTLYAVLSKR
jgi:hypothetical protein